MGQTKGIHEITLRFNLWDENKTNEKTENLHNDWLIRMILILTFITTS